MQDVNTGVLVMGERSGWRRRGWNPVSVERVVDNRHCSWSCERAQKARGSLRWMADGQMNGRDTVRPVMSLECKRATGNTGRKSVKVNKSVLSLIPWWSALDSFRDQSKSLSRWSAWRWAGWVESGEQRTHPCQQTPTNQTDNTGVQ